MNYRQYVSGRNHLVPLINFRRGAESLELLRSIHQINF